MKYYVIAGEASGDLHGGNLLRAIKARDELAIFRGMGGDQMQSNGLSLLRHIRQLSFMGFSEVLLNLRAILRNISDCKRDILEFKPNVIIFIDYPGFNLRIAKWAKAKGIKTIYYISPQIWAWNRGRVHNIKKIVDHMLVILPFEKDFYNQYEMQVEFVGHPLLDAVAELNQQTPPFDIFCSQNKLSLKPIIALLPGSRKQEIQVMLPIFLEMVRHFPNYQFVIAGAPAQDIEFYQHFIHKVSVPILIGKTYELLQQSTAALVSSGTATLEAALLGVPQVVCYKGNFISYLIAKILVKVRFISLINLIMDRKVVTELIQESFNPENLKNELILILPETEGAKKMMADYKLLKEKLGNQGASARAAERIMNFVSTPC